MHGHVPFMEAAEAKARRRHVPLSQILLRDAYVPFVFDRQWGSVKISLEFACRHQHD
jgi:hypothetical protein